MPFPSDLSLNPSKFSLSNVDEQTKTINSMLEAIGIKGPHWHEVGAAKYQQMRDAGETPLPAPIYLPNALEASLPSREAGRGIPLRVYKPDNGEPSKGIYLHFHGGGFVLGNHQSQDSSLQLYANACQLTTVSVGYRHAPSHPYPAPIHDCIDAAEYFADHAEAEYGTRLLFMGGESSGACATALTAFHLMRSRPSCHLAGLLLLYGWFDMTLTLPSIAKSSILRVINLDGMQNFKDAYLPGMGNEKLQNGAVSPLFEDLPGLAEMSPSKTLPPALFLIGTEDPLLDDTLLMSVKWLAAGAKAVVKVYPGAPHGFTAFPGYKLAEEATEVAVTFVKENLGA